MTTYRSADDKHGPLLDEHAKRGADALGEEHLELTDQDPPDDEGIDVAGRNPTQRALDAEPTEELERPVVPVAGNDRQDEDDSERQSERAPH